MYPYEQLCQKIGKSLIINFYYSHTTFLIHQVFLILSETPVSHGNIHLCCSTGKKITSIQPFWVLHILLCYKCIWSMGRACDAGTMLQWRNGISHILSWEELEFLTHQTRNSLSCKSLWLPSDLVLSSVGLTITSLTTVLVVQLLSLAGWWL